MAKKKSPGATPATTALTRAGITFTEHPYDHDPRAASYGTEAAEVLGVDPHRVLKALLADVDGRLVVGVVPVSGQLDLKARHAHFCWQHPQLVVDTLQHLFDGTLGICHQVIDRVLNML